MQNNASKLETLLAAAVDIADTREREAYMAQVCEGDAALLADLRSMVNDFFSADSLLEHPRLLLPTTAEEPEHGAGEQIGPYRLLEEIGSGGMGVVYMAEQKSPLRRLVALKVIKPGMDSHKVIARFEAERQALALMNHPNIAKVLDAGTTSNGRPYFVMELVKGVPITDYCDHQRLSNRHRLQLFITVCHAIAHAHQKGVIHRDLKPSNVLVEVHDVAPMVKVIDFGIAKAIGQQLTEKTLYTGFSEMVGTPLYMSPEQAGLSSIDVDTRSDVYSLGVLLYELLTGTTPFEKETFAHAAYDEIRRMIREDEPLRPSARVSTLRPQSLSTVSDRRQVEHKKRIAHLRGELDWIVMNALEKDRSRRYESASAFAADVQRYLSGDPIVASPPSVTYRATKFAKRHAITLLVATAVVMSLAVSTAISLWQSEKANEARRTSDQHLSELQQAFKSLDKAKANADVSYQTARAAVQQLLTRVADRRLGAIAELKDVRKQLLSDAIAFYDRLSALRPQDASILLERGEIYGLLGEFASARRDYERALIVAPDNALVHKNLGSFLVFCPDVSVRDEASKGLKHLKRATELEPQNAQFQYDLYSILSVLGQPEEATASLAKAMILDPRSPVFHARAAQSEGRLSDAISLLKKAIHESPSEIHLYYFALELLIAQGKEDAAADICTQAINAKPHDPIVRPFYVQRAEIYERNGDYEAALKHYSKAIEIAPYAAPTYKLRGRLHFTCQRYSDWSKDLETSMDLNPHDIDGLHELTYLPRITSDTKLLARCKEILENALSRSVDKAGALLQSARFHASKGDFEKGLEDFKVSQKSTPVEHRKTAWLVLFYLENASQLAALNLWDGAISDAEDQLAGEKVDYWRVRNCGELAWLLATSKDAKVRRPERALQFSQMAMETKRSAEPRFSIFNQDNPSLYSTDIGTINAPGIPEVFAMRGWLAYEAGRKAEAKEFFAQSTIADTAKPRFAFLYALICAEDNDMAEVRRTAARAVRHFSEATPNYRAWGRTAVTICNLAPDSLDDYGPVISFAKKLVAASPEDPVIASALCGTYLRAGQYAMARDELIKTEALAQKHGDSTLYIDHLWVLTLSKLGDLEGALSAYERASSALETILSKNSDTVDQLQWEEKLYLRLVDSECKNALGQ